MTEKLAIELELKNGKDAVKTLDYHPGPSILQA